MAIITLNDLQIYMADEALDEGRGAQVVEAVNSYIDNATGRSWGADKTATETHDYASVIFLRHQDVKAVTKVERGRGSGDRTELDPDTFYWNELGRVVLNNGRHGFTPYRDYVHVTYTYGTAAVPSDLKLAALSLAADYYGFIESGNQQVSSEGVGSYRVEYKSGNDSTTGRSINAAISRYRTRDL